MIRLIRTNAEHPDFILLVQYLDSYLAERDGSEHKFYAQFNTIGKIKYVVVAYENDQAVGCGAIKAYNIDSAEVKRMYTAPQYRKMGVATKILAELESWASELSYQKCILETGKKQPEAISLYQRNGYKIIPNYGQYIGVDNSVCLEKQCVRGGQE